MQYALIQSGQILRTAAFSEPPPQLPQAKGLHWAELLDTPRPEYNPHTHGLRTAPPVVDGLVCTKQWEVFPLPAEEVQANLAAHAVAQRNAAKEARAAAVEAITVTTEAGNTFDGDEVSQGRMARAITVLSATGIPSVTWVLADNTVIQATAAELLEALAMAGAAQAAVWVLPA